MEENLKIDSSENSSSRKRSGGRRNLDRKEKKITDVGYYRVISIKKDKDSLQNYNKKYETISTSSSGTSSVLHIFSGEKKEERSMRLRMMQYKQYLQIDLKSSEKALNYHIDRQESLQIEFKEQEMQLWRWGLDHLLPDFRMQSWTRQDRGELLINMARIIVNALQSRLNEVNQNIEALQIKASKRQQNDKSRLESITDSYYQSPEKLLERNPEFIEKRRRLEQFDRLCHSASLKFRQLLPELNSKAYAERESMIHQICTRYAQLLDEKQLSIDHEFTVSSNWPAFCAGYQDRVNQELALYAEYLRFVDDEREREGRLFRRWCNLVKSTSSTGSKVTMDQNGSNSTLSDLTKEASNTNSPSNPEKGEKKVIEGNATYMAHPRSIQKFIRYFALNIISKYYAIPSHLESALIALTDNVVFRNIYEVTFHPLVAKKKTYDIRWRKQCRQGRYIDPVQYAVPLIYLGRKEETQHSVDESNHEQSTNSLVEQLNHHRNSIHTLDHQEYSNLHSPMSVNNGSTSNVEFENWEVDGASNERYSEFLSKNRRKKMPQSATVSQFQVYDLVETVEPEQEPDVEGSRKESDQVDLEENDATLDSLKKTNEQCQRISTESTGSDSKQGDATPPPKTRSNRSSSIGSDGRKKSSSGKRKSGSSKFKKDAYCDSFLEYVTLRTFQARLEFLLPVDVSKAPRSESKSDRVKTPYAYASRVMGLIEIAVTPREIISCVLMSMIWLSRLANELSGKNEILGADTVFPILVNVLINANITHMHPILEYVTTYSTLESFGEAEYYMTCITAAVEFIDSLTIPEEIRIQLGPEIIQREDTEEEGQELGLIPQLERYNDREKEIQESREAAIAIQHLGEWLRDQQLMEDTMVVMMQEGWMG